MELMELMELRMVDWNPNESSLKERTCLTTKGEGHHPLEEAGVVVCSWTETTAPSGVFLH